MPGSAASARGIDAPQILQMCRALLPPCLPPLTYLPRVPDKLVAIHWPDASMAGRERRGIHVELMQRN